ncbi:hypothetical protein B0H19DRAFT_1081654 [Mycena capillaripes]|nr:hypothetical protein B0H19DRAFT_1081654 [Mycena capillaripes]
MYGSTPRNRKAIKAIAGSIGGMGVVVVPTFIREGHLGASGSMIANGAEISSRVMYGRWRRATVAKESSIERRPWPRRSQDVTRGLGQRKVGRAAMESYKTAGRKEVAGLVVVVVEVQERWRRESDGLSGCLKIEGSPTGLADW